MPPLYAVLTSWRVDYVTLTVTAIAGALYGWGLVGARRRGIPWPMRNTVLFYLFGLGSFVAVNLGFLGVYSVELRFAFTTRIALLLFAVPVLISFGKPISLAKLVSDERAGIVLERFLASRFMRFVGNAVFEGLFTLVAFMVFLTPLAGTLRLSGTAQSLLTVVVPIIGLLMVIPILENTIERSSSFITFEFMLAFAALVFDAIPGILLRLNESVVDGVGAVAGAVPPWFPSPIRDQQLSGDLLWFLAEAIDIPVLIVLFIRWTRIDRSEAKTVDELTDEQMDELMREHLRGPHR